MRIAVVDKEKCRPDKCNYECIAFCPPQKNKIKVFEIGNDKKPIIDENTCIGCGICVKKCPFNAIIIINLVKEPGEKVFQYGPNTFRLYRLPIIKERSVIGIIGRNGMGKTTAINILTGLIKPNFGEWNREFDEKEIIKRFRGTELQTYFEKLYSKQLKISYKPQNIFYVSKMYGDMKVKDFLLKVVDEEKLKEISEKFDLKNILDRNIKNLSGGELQKVLFLFTVLKDHNVLFLDEPTNYLDIYERVRIISYLEELEDTIIVIDHDLLFLDALSDIIYVVYGVQKAYGVFSYPMGVKDGINQYLEGFLRRENLKIRDKPIKLDVKPYSFKKTNEEIISWENVIVNLDGFELKSEKGSILKNEIVGIIGRNGIGKTTFIRALAGEIKYEGKINRNIKISYKPQTFEFTEEITVDQFIKRFNPNYKTDYREYLVDLGIFDLLDHKINTLSGGEAQTVYTFSVLISDADLFLLDEPFSSLDIEQRLKMSKFIREIVLQREKAAVIIEHDLLFIDYISDRMMVVLGEPGKRGYVIGPLENKEALNIFLKELGITMRKDKETKRMKINKRDSYLDRLQKSMDKYFLEEE